MHFGLVMRPPPDSREDRSGPNCTMTTFVLKESPRKSLLPKLLSFLVAAGFVAWAVVAQRKASINPRTGAPIAIESKATFAPQTLVELLALPPEELEQQDLALLGLLTAEGLRGAEKLNVTECLRTLDKWTRRVDQEVKRNYRRFLSRPEEYNHSEAEFRMGMLITVIQQDFKVRYSPDRAAPQKRGEWEPDDVFYADSRETFIHGLLMGERTGTCSSLPVLYAAVARKLGWPVHLAATKAHWYVRYDEGDRHVNIEGSGEGFNIYPDEFYKTWPFPATEEEIKTRNLLQPLNMSEVMGSLLVIRAGNLKSANRVDEAAEAWRQAARYLPDTPELRKVVGVAQVRAQESRSRERWDGLWKEVAKLAIPDGPQSSVLKDRKARLQFYMARSTHLPTIESEVQSLKNDLAEYSSAVAQLRDSALPMSLEPVAKAAMPARMQVEAGFVRIRNHAGKTMMIPAERIPAEYRHGVPPELLAAIAMMDDEMEIEAELWVHYRTQVGRDTGQAIRIPRDRIPMEYWNGLPARLEEKLQHDTDPEIIIAKLWAFQGESLNRAGAGSPRFGPPEPGSLSPCPDCGKFHPRVGGLGMPDKAQSIDPTHLPMQYQRSLPAELAERLRGKHSTWEVAEAVRRYEQERLLAVTSSRVAKYRGPGDALGRRIEIVAPTRHGNSSGMDLPLTQPALPPINPVATGPKGNP